MSMLSEHSRHTSLAISKIAPSASRARMPLNPALRTRAPGIAALNANLRCRTGSSPRLVVSHYQIAETLSISHTAKAILSCASRLKRSAISLQTWRLNLFAPGSARDVNRCCRPPGLRDHRDIRILKTDFWFFLVFSFQRKVASFFSKAKMIFLCLSPQGTGTRHRCLPSWAFPSALKLRLIGLCHRQFGKSSLPINEQGPDPKEEFYE